MTRNYKEALFFLSWVLNSIYCVYNRVGNLSKIPSFFILSTLLEPKLLPKIKNK